MNNQNGAFSGVVKPATEKPACDSPQPPQRRVLARPFRATFCRGFTLLETLVALSILAFALAGLSMLMLGNVQTGLDARRITAAGALAQQKLEDLRALGYSAAASSSTNETLSESGGTTGVTPFTRSWTVASGATAGTKNLTITVVWSDQQGSHQVQLRSILAE